MNVRTIDLTPTWSGMANVIITLIENGNSTARAAGIAELNRMAILADAAADLHAALFDLLPEVDDEICQRKNGGNDEDWTELDALSNRAHAALRKAGDRA